MKLGLLVVVAVAVLLPSFSESRIVSKCELRDKLRDQLKLSKRVEERTLTTIICEVDRMSHLDTSLVIVFGDRIPTTPKPTVATVPSTTGANTMTTAATLQPTSTNSTTQMTNTPTTTATTTSATTTATNTTTKTTTASMTTTTSPATTNSTISSMNTTLVSNSTGGIRRQKREADSSSGEDDSRDERSSEEDAGNSIISSMSTSLDSNSTGSSKRQKREDDSRDETSSEEDTGYIMKPQSLGLYGLFQLSDKDFCNSGYRWSRNACNTSCTAFTDDDVSDDIACALSTGYLGRILENASNSCRHIPNFFKGCN